MKTSAEYSDVRKLPRRLTNRLYLLPSNFLSRLIRKWRPEPVAERLLTPEQPYKCLYGQRRIPFTSDID